MSDTRKINIIGVGDDGVEGLSSNARQMIEEADLLVGGPTTLAGITQTGAERITVRGDLDSLVDQLASQADRRIVILATGDPLFYGTARYLCDKLGKERFEVFPHVSSMQLAFARVKESWDEAYLTNLATQSLDRVAEKVRSAEKVGIFTTEQLTPAKVCG